MPPSPAQNLPEGIKGSPDLRTCLLPYLLALGPAVGLFQLRTLSHKGVLFFFFFKKKNLNYIPSYLQDLKGSTQIKPVLPLPPYPSIIGFLELGAKGPPDQSSSHCPTARVEGGSWVREAQARPPSLSLSTTAPDLTAEHPWKEPAPRLLLCTPHLHSHSFSSKKMC